MNHRESSADSSGAGDGGWALRHKSGMLAIRVADIDPARRQRTLLAWVLQPVACSGALAFTRTTDPEALSSNRFVGCAGERPFAEAGFKLRELSRSVRLVGPAYP